MGPNCTKTDGVGKERRRGREFGDISRYACPSPIFTANIAQSREKVGKYLVGAIHIWLLSPIAITLLLS